ncbi:MAG: helix-turn-helix domain-containing protein [Dermatophilaceae bacterium]
MPESPDESSSAPDQAPSDEVRITDPQALRALAHPARQQVIMELYSGEVLTASEAAQICGMTPSAMSYHLRVLERAGIVERVESSDGRERPWKAAAESLTIDRAAHSGAGTAILQKYTGTWTADLIAGLERLYEDLGAEQNPYVLSRVRFWVTDAEMRELAGEIIRLWDRYKGRTRADHPEGARLRDVYSLVLPTEDG